MVIAASAFVSALFKVGCFLRNNFVSSQNNFEPTPIYASSLTLRCDTPHTSYDKLHECSSDGQVQACSQLIGPGLSPGVITVTGHVTRHPQLSIFHAKYTPSTSLQQPLKQDDHYSPVLSCHSVARHISSRPDLGLLEIPRIKIHFRLHFLF